MMVKFSYLASALFASHVSAQTCSNLLVDDFVSQSRLTFLFYNSLFQATSDDGTMKSVIVGNPANHVTLTPTNTNSYWFTQFNCVNAQSKYGGISLRIKAPAGSSFNVELQSSTSCSTDTNLKAVDQTTTQLGWTFDGTEKLYSISFSKFSGIGTGNLMTLFFNNFKKATTFGPIQFYCGDTVSEYIPPTVSQPSNPTETVPATTATATALVIDSFSKKDSNALGFWHGGDDGMTLTYGTNKLTIKTEDSDLSYYTQVTETCRDLTSFDGGYLHIAYSGSNTFSVALQQHNSACNENIAPYPETWDSIEAARYASATDIYIPMTHFNIVRKRSIAVALKGFYTTNPTTFTKVEIVKTIPSGFTIPAKLPSGNLVFSCTRPNSFAFAIDDGDPVYAQQVLKTIRDANIKVTFFTVGAPLLDPNTNLSNVYTEMKNAGHQIALHSYTHPKMEGLQTYADIDWEYQQDIDTVSKVLNLKSTYFRPPFGTEGARMRQRLAAKISNPTITGWSVDIEDWLWAETTTPEKQLDAFKRDVNKGGNLVVMHYLYPSTVSYLKQFIDIAKATGKQLMRVDQCMQDPNAPPL